MKSFSSCSRLIRMFFENKALRLLTVGIPGARLAEISASPHWPRRRWMRLFGRPGAAGAVLLVACLAFYPAVILPAKQRLDTARQSAIDTQKHGKHDAARNNQPPAQQLVEFYRSFPNEKNLLPWLEKIFTLAHDQGISLDQGEYKVSSDKLGKLMRFQMIMPIKGEYPQIRKYLDSLLVEIPIASLEQLQLERQKVGDPALEARIRLALYLEQAI